MKKQCYIMNNILCVGITQDVPTLGLFYSGNMAQQFLLFQSVSNSVLALNQEE